MSPLIQAIALWLADVHLLAGALLAALLPALLLLSQPVQRMAAAKSTLAALASLAILCALPGWCMIHLLSAETPPAPAALAASEPPAQTFTPPVFDNERTLDRPFAPIPDPAPAPIAEPAPAAAPSSLSWPILLVLLQATGSAAVIIWLVTGAIMVARVRRTSHTASPELQQLLMDLTGATQPPALLISAQISTPVALGLRRPAIILPATLVQPPALPGGSATQIVAPELSGPHGQRNATPGQIPGLNAPTSPSLTAILAHEFAHIAAGDLRTLALSRLLLVLLWPHPLFWLLRRRIRFDQESLADAAAAEVAGRIPYAEQLVGWARTAPPRIPRLAGAIGLWEGPSQLKRRIALLLDEQLTILRTASRGWRIGTTCAALAAAALLSLVTLQRQEAAEAATPATTSNSAGSELNSEPAKIRGRIVLEDGSSATMTGLLNSVSKYANGDSATKVEARVTDSFDITVEPGSIVLKHFADGYAPSWVGPLEAESGESYDVVITLRLGLTTSVEVVAEDGAPIPRAKVRRAPVIDGATNGTIAVSNLDDGGRLKLEHLASVPYHIWIEAPGFQPLRDHEIVFAANGTSRLTMRKTRTVRGMIRDAAGGPAAQARILSQAELDARGAFTTSFASAETPTAVADANGHFSLDQLADGVQYACIIETADKARLFVPEICAGDAEKEYVVPARRDLRGTILGDVSGLARREGKPYVRVYQRFEAKPRRGIGTTSFGGVFGGEVTVTRSPDGGEFTYEGLLEGEVEITAGDETQTFDVAPEGVTEVTLQLASNNSDAAVSTHELRVRVVDAEGKPLAGAKVRQNHVHIPPDVPPTVDKTAIKNENYITGRDGVAIVTWSGDSVDLRLWVTHPDGLPLHAMWAKEFQSDGDQIPPEFTFVMKRGTKVGGVVLDESGHAIVGAKVQIYNATADAFSLVRDGRPAGMRPIPVSWLVEEESAIVTDSEGRWTANKVPADADLQIPSDLLEGIAPGRLAPPIRLRVSHPDYQSYEGEKREALNPPTLKALRASTAEVRLAAKPREATSTEGRAATARPSPPAWLRFEPNVAQGRVCDPDDKPLAGVEVTLYRHQLGGRGGGEAPQPIAAQTTGPDGLYRFENAVDVAKEFPDGLPDERFMTSPVPVLIVVGRAPGRASAWTNDTAHSAVRTGFTQQLVMDRAATLAGRITTREGTPVANAVVQCGQLVPQPDNLIRTARTDADGRYAITDLAPYDAEKTRRERDELAKQNPNAAWTMVNFGMNVHVEHPDFATASSTIQRIPETVDLQLAPAAVIEGVVVRGDSTGVPLPAANVMVHLMQQAPPKATPGTLNFQVGRAASAKTDAAGRYRIGSLPAGSYVLNAQSEGLVCQGLRDVKVGEGETTTAPEMTLTRGGTVRIKLVDAATKQPLPLPDGTRGYVYPHPQPPLPSQRLVTFDKAVGETQMPAGRYGFTVSIPGETPTAPYWQSADFAPGTPPAIAHEVKEAETIEVEIPVKRQDQQAMATGTLQLYAPSATSSGDEDEPEAEPAAQAVPAATPAASQGSSTGGIFDELNPARGSTGPQAQVISVGGNDSGFVAQDGSLSIAPLDQWGYGIDNAPRR